MLSRVGGQTANSIKSAAAKKKKKKVSTEIRLTVKGCAIQGLEKRARPGEGD